MSKDFAAQLADRWSVQVLDPRRPGVRAAIEGAVRQAIQTLGLHIFAEIVTERHRQDEIHPNTTHIPDGTGGGGRKTWETIARISCDHAAREGRLTYAHVFNEETAEVLAEEDPTKLRAELVQVGAVCVKWIEELDRRLAKESAHG